MDFYLSQQFVGCEPASFLVPIQEVVAELRNLLKQCLSDGQGRWSHNIAITVGVNKYNHECPRSLMDVSLRSGRPAYKERLANEGLVSSLAQHSSLRRSAFSRSRSKDICWEWCDSVSSLCDSLSLWFMRSWPLLRKTDALLSVDLLGRRWMYLDETLSFKVGDPQLIESLAEMQRCGLIFHRFN